MQSVEYSLIQIRDILTKEAQDRITYKSVTILNGASLSEEMDISGWVVVAVEQPASCEGTMFTFQVSIDGVVHVDLYDSGGAELVIIRSATIAQALQLLPSEYIQGASKLKIRSGTGAAPVVQTTTNAVLKVGLVRVP